ncbi:MAG: hypothetical protein IJG33_15170 [Selenomonadaceae bacterium]|nr:hypothetical protein [Selenomonadaceae bacterium]MBR0288120.1 hypothetical protein [Selenomonadaceae bacterium]
MSENKFRLFEMDYTINGTHATRLKFLAKKNARDVDEPDNPQAAKIFERYIDVYMNAAVWGIYYRRKAKTEKSKDTAAIRADAFIRERETCIFLYRLVMLLDDSENLTQTERIDRAFRYDTLPDKADELKKNLELFHDYVRGGIDLIYEKFTDGCMTREDYLERTFNIMTEFKSELDGIDYSAELAKLIKS